MKTSKKLALATMVAVLSISNVAFPKELVKPNVAVVDVQRIISSSPEISALNTDRKNKVSDLVSYVEKARSEIAKENNATKKKTLEENYIKEINSKKEALDKEYVQNLSNVDKQISTIIKTKSTGYDLVLTKNSVLQGGIDITNEIVKELK